MSENQVLANLRHDLDTLRVNLDETLARGADVLIGANENSAAGALLVFQRYAAQSFGNVMHWFSKMLASAPTAEAAAKGRVQGKRKPAGGGEHRHKYGGDGKCTCGATRQRAARGATKPEPARPSAESRTQPLVFTGFGKGTPPLPDGAEDPFAGGVMGSSSATERGR